MTPTFSIRTRPTPGAPYTIHSIVLADGRTVHEQLSPYSAGEAESRVRAFLNPQPLTPRIVSFNSSIRSPGRPKKGQTWRDTYGTDDPEAA